MIWRWLAWFEETEFATWIREGDFIAQPFATFYVLLGVHSIGMAIVVGICMMVSVRVFGFMRGAQASQINRLMRLAWWGFYINFASGLILLMGQPRREMITVAFWIKMIVIVMAVVSMRVMQKALASVEPVPDPDGRGTAVEVVPRAMRLMAFLIDIFWLTAIVAGRLVGYTQPPPPA